MTAMSGLKKVLVLSIWEDVWSLGGEGGVADELHFIRHLNERGVELDFLVPEPVEKGRFPCGERLIYHTYPNIFSRYAWAPKLVKRLVWPSSFRRAVTGRLRSLARETKPDILLGFTYYSLGPLERIGRELGIPTAVKMFGVMYLDRFDYPRMKYWWKNFEQLSALKHPVDLYIVLNDGTRGKTSLTRLGIPEEKITFLPNGMDTGWADVTVDRSKVQKELHLPEDRMLVVTFSRLVRSKRVDQFLEAASLLDSESRRKIALVVGGDGPERPALERRAGRLGLDVIFTGVIPHRKVVDFLKASDIFVGTNELTNMSLPPCEAILCGIPVVAFDNSGTSEVVRDGETGLLASEGDVEELSRKLARIINDGELRRRLSEGAAAFGRTHFVSWDDRISMEAEALESLLDRSITRGSDAR
jgi:glycosyltransferase involved in cell wall biosynthesis